MIAKITRVLLLPAAALAMVSCGGDGGEPVTAESAGQLFSAINDLVKGLPRDANSVPALPISGATTTASSVKTMATDCETTEPTTPIDGDGDNIAKYKKSSFDCTDQTSGTYKYNRAGYYIVEDLDDTVAGVMAGLKAEFNMTKFNSVNLTNGEETNTTHKGSWTYKKEGSSLVSKSSYEGHYKFYSAASNYDIDYDFTYAFNFKMTPVNDAQPWDAGSHEFSGSYTLSGKFMYEDHSGSHSNVSGGWSLKYYSKGLQYVPTTTCQFFYKSGSVFIEDGTNTYELRYNCTEATVYVNGTKSDIWTPQS